MVIPAITEESLRSFPKVLLHDHLDGGLRPKTIIEIADRTNYLHLPSYEVKELEAWMLATADQGKLELYLEAFTHTIAVMQNEESLFRVRKNACMILKMTESCTLRFVSHLNSLRRKGLH